MARQPLRYTNPFPTYRPGWADEVTTGWSYGDSHGLRATDVGPLAG